MRKTMYASIVAFLAAAAFAISAAHAAPAPHADSPAVTSAKHELATARAHLKTARDAQRAQRKADAKAKRVAKLRAALAKAEHDAITSDDDYQREAPSLVGGAY